MYWKEVLSKPSLKSEYDQAAHKTLLTLANTEHKAVETKAILIDIMMAQDFQDLTGLIIKKITALTNELEAQLIRVLIDFSPDTLRKGVNLEQNDSKQILSLRNLG